MTTETLARTPLYELHRELGARLVPFAGYEMPVQYPPGILKEHQHTRAAAGLFDVSHMGQARLIGDGAAAALERLVPVNVLGLKPGRQRYALFTNDQGGILDDLMISNFGPTAGGPVAMGYVETALAEPGTELAVQLERFLRDPSGRDPNAASSSLTQVEVQGDTFLQGAGVSWMRVVVR